MPAASPSLDVTPAVLDDAAAVRVEDGPVAAGDDANRDPRSAKMPSSPDALAPVGGAAAVDDDERAGLALDEGPPCSYCMHGGTGADIRAAQQLPSYITIQRS